MRNYLVVTCCAIWAQVILWEILNPPTRAIAEDALGAGLDLLITRLHFSPLKLSVSALLITVITTTTLHLPRCAIVMMMATSPVKINTCSLSLAESDLPEHYYRQSLWVVFCGRLATITLVRRTRTKF